MNFLFVYGSLIHPQSCAMTGRVKRSVPVVMNDLARSWCVNVALSGGDGTAVGVFPKEGKVCNGLLLEIEPEDWEHFDRREEGYRREQWPVEKVCFLESSLDLQGQSPWFYHPLALSTPNSAFPIHQSYVDVILAGCLKVGEAFAHQFIETTQGWQSFWQDRLFTKRFDHRYLETNALEEVDRLINSRLRHLF